MANARYYSSIALPTTLQVGINASATSIQVASSAGFPGSFPFTLAIDYGSASEELVEVASGGPSIYTVSRAWDGTSATSHNPGAVIRHVTSAVDFTESRTHEASTTNIHGVTGVGNDLVGTTSTQTLTNKTLTAPTINGGALTGTITGTPTFSGAVTLGGGGTFTGTFGGSPTFSGTVTHSGATNLNAGGALAGTFTGTPTFSGNLTFSGAPTFSGASVNITNTLNANGLIQSTKGSGTAQAYASIVTADTFDRYRIDASGKTEWGPGNATRDTNLFRTAADTLRTDDSFQVGTNLAVTGTTALTGNVTTTGTITDSGTSIRYRPAVTGSQTISFASATSDTTAVSFGVTFATAPNVFLTIASGAGSTIGWMCRSLNITTTGFDLNVSTNGSAAAWSNNVVKWVAIAN